MKDASHAHPQSRPLRPARFPRRPRLQQFRRPRSICEATRKVVDAAIEQGITLFDTADVYGERGGSETALGEVLGARRKDIVLATKFGMPWTTSGIKKGGSRRYIMEAVEASLKRLRTDWIDLYQIHRFDPLTADRGNVARARRPDPPGQDRATSAAPISPAWQMVDAAWTARDRGVAASSRPRTNTACWCAALENELIPAAQHYGMGLLPYFPLANGAADRKVPPQCAAARGRAPDERRSAPTDLQRDELGQDRGADRLRRSARQDAGRARLLLARGRSPWFPASSPARRSPSRSRSTSRRPNGR